MALLNEFRPLVIRADNKVIAEGQRVRVQGSKNMTLLADFFLFEIYNLSSEDLATINNSKMLYSYGMDDGVICCGEIDDIYEKADGVNMVTSISVVDGKSFWATKVSQSLGGGNTVSSTFRTLMQNAYTGAFAAPDLRMIRGQTYSGRLAESISMLAKSVHARAFLTNNTVFITAKGQAAEVVTIKEGDVIDDRNNSQGMRIIRTVVKGYPTGALVNLSGDQYRLVSQKINADNYKGSWESILVLVKEKELPFNGMEGG